MKKLLSFVLIIFFSLTVSHAGENNFTLKIEGMTCPTCAFSVENQLEKLKGIGVVRIRLGRGEATINLNAGANLEEQELHDAIEMAGFKLVSISKE